MVDLERHHEHEDEGVILVIWVLCLSLLAALLLGVITLGNLLQSTDNAQNAADAAALAGENLLGPQGGNLVIGSIFIPENDRCDIDSQRVVTRCASYRWLTGNYIYESGQWYLIGNSPGDVSPLQALQYASTAWTCPSLWPRTRRNPARYCEGVNIFRPSSIYGLNASLADATAFNAANNAAQEAISIQEKYGFTSHSGCSEPAGYFLVGLSSVTCIAYDPAGTIWVSVPDPSLLPGDRTATIQKASWATETNGLVVLCGGMPPGGNCT